jgi:lipopolysaccharide export system permease protein
MKQKIAIVYIGLPRFKELGSNNHRHLLNKLNERWDVVEYDFLQPKLDRVDCPFPPNDTGAARIQVWDFYNGTIYFVATDRSYRNILRFEHQQLQLPRTPLTLAENSRDYGEMNISQALEQLEIERLGGNDQKIRKLQVRIQQKIAFPFVCVIFGLVGSVMGSIPQRTGRGTSFGISVIVIFSYYLLLSVSGALAQAGILSPIIGAWLPNLFGLVTGLFLLIRVAQR